jgi:hypothetical protein
LVRRSPFILGDSAAFDRDVQSPSAPRPWILGSSRWRRPRQPLARRRGPLTESRLLQSLTTRRRPHGCSFAVPLMRFLPLQHVEDWRIHLPRVCLTRFVPPPGFLTLLAASSPPARPALFHAGSAHGVGVPYRAFPSGRSRGASRRPQPSLRSPPGAGDLSSSWSSTTSRGTGGGVSSSSVRRLAPFGPHPGPGTSPESVTRRRRLTEQRARCSPGVSASPGYCANRACEVGTCPPRSSHGLRLRRPSSRSRHATLAGGRALRSLNRPGSGWASSRRHIDPREVCQPHLPSQEFENRRSPGS